MQMHVRLLLPILLLAIILSCYCGTSFASLTPQVSVHVQEAHFETPAGHKGEVALTLRLQRHYGISDVGLKVEIQTLNAPTWSSGPSTVVLSARYPARETTTLQVLLGALEPGLYYVTAYIIGGPERLQFEDSDSIYLQRGHRASLKLIRPYEFAHALNEAAQSPKRLFPGKNSQPGPLLTNDVNITVTFEDEEKKQRPLPRAYVEVWLDDWIFDDLLGTTELDDKGKAQLTVNIPPNFFGQDQIYIVVKTEKTSKLELGTTTSLGKPITSYSYRSDDTVVHQGSAVYISYKIKDAFKPLQAFIYLTDTWLYAKDVLGYSPSEFTAWYPADATYFSHSYNVIALKDEKYKGPYSIAHEFAHEIMWSLYGNWFPPDNGGDHAICPDTAVTKGLAWSEGYANAYALSSNKSTDGVYYWTIGGASYDYERYSCSYTELETDEGRVTAALWDLLDEHDDCNEGNTERGRDDFCDKNENETVGPEAIYRKTLEKQHESSVMEAWWILNDEFLTSIQKPKAQEVMKYNWVKYLDTKINSFTWKLTDASTTDAESEKQVKCGPPYCFSSVAKWSAEAHNCSLIRIQGGTSTTVGTGLSGTYSTALFLNQPPVQLELSCRGWGDVTETLCSPLDCVALSMQGSAENK